MAFFRLRFHGFVIFHICLYLLLKGYYVRYEARTEETPQCRSGLVRNNLSKDSGISLWANMNSRILDNYQRPPPWPSWTVAVFLLQGFGLKGQSNEIFDPQFFSTFEPVWATDQLVKIFFFVFGLVFAEIFVFFHCSAQHHTAQSQVPRSIILRGVNH